MQSRRWQPGSSDELDVFGATRYFAGRADCATTAHQLPAAVRRLTQAKAVIHEHDKMMGGSFRGHDDEQLGLGVHELELVPDKPSAGRSKLAGFVGFMVSPSPGTSFRKRSPLPPFSGSTAAARDEPMKVSLSSTTSSRESTEIVKLVSLSSTTTSSAASVQLEGLDLGVATGDRRLQGVKVVRGSGDDEERWVVRCTSCWDHQEEEHAAMFNAVAPSDDRPHQVEDEGEYGAEPGNWESDSSSDLFDLDIEYVDL